MIRLLRFIISSEYFKLYLILSIVLISLFDLFCLYIFLNIINSQIINLKTLIACIFLFFSNIFIQNIGIKLFSYISFKIVSDKFIILHNKLINCRPFLLINDERINKLFGIEFIRINERLVLPAINAFARFINTIFILTFIVIKSPFAILTFIFLISIVYLYLFLLSRPRIKKFDYMIEKTINKLGENIEFLNLYKIEILVYKLQKKIREEFLNNQKQYVLNSAELQRLSALPRPIIEGTIFIAITISIILTRNFDLLIYATLGLGALKILPSLQMIFSASSVIMGNLSALKEYSVVSDLCDDHYKNNFKTDISYSKINEKWKKFTIKNISSSTTPRINFDSKDIEIKRGQKVVICGESGIGKSTLLNCIAGLELETNIKLEIDNKIYSPIELINSNLVGYLRQNAIIFKGTLEENLTLHRKFDSEYLNYYLKKLGLRELNGEVMKLNKKLLNRGSNLSFGQMQRIAFIRTLLFRRSIFLLDEPTSSVDENIRDLMWNELSKDPDCTVICVTHDSQFKNNFDIQIAL